MVDRFVLFWGGYLSNWYIAPFTIDGVLYNCVEQYMMAEKARTFGDEAALGKILRSTAPKAQKEAGRKVNGYRDGVWAKVRFDVVLRGTLAKYRQNPDLCQELLATGERVIAEASPYDTIWGIGLAEDDPDAQRPSKWRGENLLGKVLMNARTVLRKEAI